VLPRHAIASGEKEAEARKTSDSDVSDFSSIKGPPALKAPSIHLSPIHLIFAQQLVLNSSFDLERQDSRPKYREPVQNLEKCAAMTRSVY
jgi:hypothetical protein